MLTECLNAPHYTVGAWYEGELAGFSVLYYPHDKAEDLSLYLEGVEINGLKAANNKLCIVRKEYRGNELQYRLGMLLEKHARETGTELLCVTVSPKNTPSINNVLRMGFVYNRTLEKYGFERNLYYKYLR
jgi:GNAT superfamily N-acetyltransferase